MIVETNKEKCLIQEICPPPKAYQEHLHTGWPQISLWNRELGRPLLVTFEIRITGIFYSLMSGPILSKVTIYCRKALLLFSVLFQLCSILTPSQVLCVLIALKYINIVLLFGWISPNWTRVHAIPCLPKAFSRCLSASCWRFRSSTCWSKVPRSTPITRLRVLKMRALRSASAVRLRSAALSPEPSSGRSTSYILQHTHGEGSFKRPYD